MSDKRRILSATAVIAFCSVSLFADDSLNDMRLILQRKDVNSINPADSETRIRLGSETEPLANLKTGVIFYGAAPVNGSEREIPGPGKESRMLLGEAWLRLDTGVSEVTAGRMKLDWPLLRSDTVALVPNLFEAVNFETCFDRQWSFTAGYARRASGTENGITPFLSADLSKALHRTSPEFSTSTYELSRPALAVAGIRYQSSSANAQIWLGTISDMMNQTYFKFSHSFGTADVGFQALRQQLSPSLRTNGGAQSGTGIDHTLLGLQGSWEYAALPLSFSAAYNEIRSDVYAPAESITALGYVPGDSLDSAGYTETFHTRREAKGYRLGILAGDSRYKELGIALNHVHLADPSNRSDEISLTVGKKVSSLSLQGRFIRLSNTNDLDSVQVRVGGSYLF